MKIIDATQQNEPLNVYLWSNRKEDFTVNIKIGDILMLNNFRIDSHQDRLQAKKAFKNEDSYFRIFNGAPEINNYNPIDKKVGLDDEEGKILNSLNQLRAFSKTHFSKHKVPILFKDNKKLTSSDFDVILKVIECAEMSNFYKIRLTNEKEEFHLNYTRHINPGVYKVRSVADIKWEDKIGNLSGNDYTFFLEIPSWMQSHEPKEWDRLIASSDASKKKARRAKIDSKIIGTSKKIKKMDLKTLFSKGTPFLIQMSIKKK